MKRKLLNQFIKDNFYFCFFFLITILFGLVSIIFMSFPFLNESSFNSYDVAFRNGINYLMVFTIIFAYLGLLSSIVFFFLFIFSIKSPLLRMIFLSLSMIFYLISAILAFNVQYSVSPWTMSIYAICFAIFELVAFVSSCVTLFNQKALTFNYLTKDKEGEK